LPRANIPLDPLSDCRETSQNSTMVLSASDPCPCLDILSKVPLAWVLAPQSRGMGLPLQMPGMISLSDLPIRLSDKTLPRCRRLNGHPQPRFRRSHRSAWN